MTKQWITDIIVSMEVEAKRLGNISIDCSYDDNEEPEVFITLKNNSACHGRLCLGEESDGKHYAFFSIGWQGCGCGQFDIEPTSKEAVKVVQFLWGVLLAEQAFREEA